MVVSMFAPFVAGTPTDPTAATPGSSVNESYSQTENIDPAPVDQSLEEANGTVEVVVRAEEFEVPDASATSLSSEGVIEDLQAHAEESQQPIVDYAGSTEGVTVLNQFWLANAVVLELDTEKVDVQQLATQEGVTSVHANFEVKTPEPANVSGTADASNAADTTYGLDQINATEVWEEYDTKGGGAKVAVLDTGVDASHPDIDLHTENASDPTSPGGWAEFDAEGDRVEGSTPHDTDSHGTHTSGTVSGGNASGEYIGVAPEVSLMHGLVLPSGSGEFVQIIAGMQWAVEENADVISMSLGAEGHYSQFIEPVRNAQDAGTLVAASSGNTNAGSSGSPGNVYDSFAIGASNEGGDIASFSSGEVVDTDQAWGSDAPEDWPDEYTVPDVAAPGVAVKSAEPGGSYQELSGTSMSAPHVAGTLALLIAASGGTANDTELRTALETTAWKPEGEPEDPDTRYGHGLVDAAAAAEIVAAETGVAGTVADAETGTAVDGVTVETEDGFRSPTDENGEYFVRLGAGNHTLSADAFGYESASADVTVPDSGTAEQNFSLDPEFEAETVENQPDEILGGGSVTTEIRTAHADSFAVEQVGNFTASDATLLVDGTEYEFGETITLDRYYGPLTVTVETADGSSGELALEYALEGMNDSVELATGSTTVHAEGDRIGVVAAPGDSHADAFASLITEQSVTYQTTVITPQEAIDDTEQYDALVAHSFESDSDGLTAARQLLDATTDHQVGLVVMDQQGSGANAISRLSQARGYPRAVNYPSHFLVGSPSYYANIENGSHQLWDGIDFDNITTAPPDFVRSETLEWTTVEWAGFDGETRAVAGQYLLSGGPSIGTDAPRGTMLMGSHGYTGSVGEGDYTEKANRAVSNAVGWALEADQSNVFVNSGTPTRVDPGTAVEATFDVENLTKVKTELTDRSTISEDDLSLQHGGEDDAFGSWRTYDSRDDDAYSISVEVADDATGMVELEHTFVVEQNGETRTFDVTTQRTSVYEPPLEVPADADSIQEATRLAVPNAEIVVSEGTYTEQVVVPADQPSYGITIRGEDGATPTVRAPENLGNDSGVIEVQAKQVTVENLDVEGPENDNQTYGVLAGVNGLSIPAEHTTIRNVSVDDSHWGIGLGGQSGGSSARHSTVSNVQVTNASTGVVLGAPRGSFLLVDASDTAVEDSYIEAENTGILAWGRQVANVDIANNTIAGADVGVFQDGANDLNVANNTITGAERGIYGLEGAYGGTYENNRIEADTGVYLNGTYFGGYNDQKITNNVFETDVGVRMNDFREFLAPGSVWINYNDFEETDVSIESTRDPDDLDNVDARLNWFGERGPDNATIEQTRNEIIYDPFLSATPDEVDQDDPRAFGTGLDLEAGTSYAVGVPGPVAGNVSDVFGSDFEGAVYGYDDEAQQWEMLTGDEPVSSLDGLYVKPTENATATLSFHHGEGAGSAPGQTTLSEGWNFVGATQMTGVEDAYDNGSADPSLALGLFDRPDSSLTLEQGELDGPHVFGSNETEPTVSPFDAAFVYSKTEGTHVGQLQPNPSLDELYDGLDVTNRVDNSILGSSEDARPQKVSTSLSDAEFESRLQQVAIGAISSHDDWGDARLQKAGAVARASVHDVASIHDHGLSDEQLDSIARTAVERMAGENLTEAYANTEPVNADALREAGFGVSEVQVTSENATSALSTGATGDSAGGASSSQATASANDTEYEVAFVDAMIPAWNAGERMVEELDAQGDLNASYNVTAVHATTFFDDLNASLDEYDVVVANNLGTTNENVDDAKIERFVEAAKRPDLGVVYLGQKDQTPPNSIKELSSLRGDPAERTGEMSWSVDEIYYEISEDHALFEGVGEKGDRFTLMSDFFGAAYYSSFDDYDGNVVGQVGTDESGTVGAGVGVDDVRNEVLLSTGAFNGFVIESDYPEGAYRLMANAIEAVEPSEAVVLEENASTHVEPGDAVESSLKVSQMDQLKVELADESTVSADDLTLSLDGSTAEFGEWRTYDSPVSEEAYSITAETDDDTTGKVVLDVTVESRYTDGAATLTVGPTAVYDPPLTVGEDVATIQEALDIAPADGRTVYVENGTYEESVTVSTPDLTLRAADGAEPTVESADGTAVAIEADGVSIEGIDVTAGGDHDGVVAEGVDNVTVTDLGVDGATTGVEITNATMPTVEGVTVTDATTGVDVTGTENATVANATVTDAGTGVSLANVTATNVTATSVTDVDTGVSLAGSTTEASVTDVTASGGTGVSLSDLDGENVRVRFNDFSATEVGVDSDLAERFDARLNYLGHGTADTAIEGNVSYQPLLTEPPEKVDHDDPVAIGVELRVEAGESTAIGVPGYTNQTVGELFSDDFEGTVYDYNAGSGKPWTEVSGDHELDTLEGLRVDAETDGHAVVEFRGDGPSAPGTVELEHGWNFIAAPMYADANSAFQVGSAELRMVRDKHESPTGQLGPASESNGSYVFGSGKQTPNVSAFQGYFVHVEEEGTVPSYLHSDVTMDDLYSLLGLDASDLENGDDSESDDEEAESDVAPPSEVGSTTTSPVAVTSG